MRLVIIEGHDGTGKTTFARLLKENYESRGFKVAHVKFPSRLPSDAILASPVDSQMFYLTNFHGVMKRFRGDTETEILIADRSFITTMVYQGFYQDEDGKDKMDAHAFQNLATQGSRIFSEGIPNLEVEIVFLSCEISTALARITERASEEKDAIERMSALDRQKKVQTLQDRYILAESAMKMGWFLPLQPGGNAFESAHIIKIDTTKMSQEGVVKAYNRRSLEPEFFNTKVRGEPDLESLFLPLSPDSYKTE